MGRESDRNNSHERWAVKVTIVSHERWAVKVTILSHERWAVKVTVSFLMRGGP